MSGTPSADELLDVAVQAARVSGALLAQRFATGGERAVDTKSSVNDPVSEADHASERAIREVLDTRRPDDGIMGEEGEDVAGTSGLRWIVDPLDGTVNFLYGIPQWCVSICCEDRVGVVFDPVRDELFAVVAGEASTLNGAPLPERRAPAGGLAGALVATGFGYEARVREQQARVVREVVPRVRDIRRAGSAALDLAWCAAGRVDAYYEHGVKTWDIAAGALLCRGVGLRVEPLPAGDERPAGLLAAPAEIAGELVDLVA
ncbi:inositol monophosphatase [Paraconexibacter sp.]|uniref:inositol monophosphatase family protein n=1 Tax=Paraconexibacter sp. TaxID=2949640 RepID=UPI0035613FAE